MGMDRCMDGKRNLLAKTTGKTTKKDPDLSLLKGLRSRRQGMTLYRTKFGSALLHGGNRNIYRPHSLTLRGPPCGYPRTSTRTSYVFQGSFAQNATTDQELG